MAAKLKRNEPKRTMKSAVLRARSIAPTSKYAYPLQAPAIMNGVVPKGLTAPVVATDYAPFNPYDLGGQFCINGAYFTGFPGYPYLSQLATRAEYRAMASALATEITREWIEFTSKEDDDTGTAEKISQIEDEFKRLNLRGVIQKAVEHDCYFGRAQVFIDIEGADRKTPLIIDPRTIKKGTLNRVATVEAIWTTPSMYNSIDPSAVDFYKPRSWFMLGQDVHSSRLCTVITRELPDILKPAFNFGGMSLSQLAEPYVDNWLRTRQSVADLINNFSITALKTQMAQTLQGNDDGEGVFDRADLFTATRSNRGLMLLDKENEELVQLNVPLGGLHELQSQAQEQLCSVSRTPAIVLTGISPSGLNASSDGEIRVYYDWIAAQQEAFWREPIDTVLRVVQMSLFGQIDPDIGFKFVPLYQQTPKELSEIRKADAETAQTYVAMAALAPDEVRANLASDPDSGYMGIDTERDIMPLPVDPTGTGEAPPDGMDDDDSDPEPPKNDKTAKDAEFNESDHPRADNGKFGSGGGSATESKGSTKLKVGNVAIKTPLSFTKDPDWKTYKIDHPDFPKDGNVDANAITIKNGKIIGMKPTLAKQLGIETHGEAAAPTERQAAKKAEADKAKAESDRQAKILGGTLGILHNVQEGKMTKEDGQAAITALLKEHAAT